MEMDLHQDYLIMLQDYSDHLDSEKLMNHKSGHFIKTHLLFAYTAATSGMFVFACLKLNYWILALEWYGSGSVTSGSLGAIAAV